MKYQVETSVESKACVFLRKSVAAEVFEKKRKIINVDHLKELSTLKSFNYTSFYLLNDLSLFTVNIKQQKFLKTF